jgi:type I restriction enzyme S subunit
MGSSSFAEVSLGEIADFRNGKAISPEKYTPIGKHPVFGSNGQIASSDEVLYQEPAVVIGRVGAYCGCVHYVPRASWVTDNAIIALPKDGNDLRYLFYLLGSLELQRTAIGSAQPLMTQGGLKVLRTKAPPLAEQKAIAAILGALDDKIELNRRMNSTLEAMARALFQSWFVDFDPVRAKLDGRKPEGMDKATAALFPDAFQESSLGPVPKEWTAQRLPDAVEVNPRRTLKAGTIAPYLDMKNMPTQGHSAGEVIDREFSSGTKFQNGDTLLARITPCLENGKTGYVDFLENGQIGWGSTEYIILVPKPPLPPQFGYLLARSDALRTHAIQNMTGTSGRQRVPSECFNTFWLAIPPPGIALRFDELTAPLMAKIKANTEQSRTLATLRDTLLPKLLSGELSVAAVFPTVEASA